MAMIASDIERLIKMRIPDGGVTIRDLAGTATTISNRGVGDVSSKTGWRSNQSFTKALKVEIGGKLHALALQTSGRRRHDLYRYFMFRSPCEMAKKVDFKEYSRSNRPHGLP